MKLIEILTLFLISITVVHAVDHGKFRRCDQTGFCKRHRLHPPPCYYVVNNSTIKIENEFVRAELHPQGHKCVPLLFSLHFLLNGAVRSRVVELNPLNNVPRWEDDVVVLQSGLKEIQTKIISSEEAKSQGIEITDNTVYVTAGNKVIVGIVVAPFSFTVFVDGKARIGFNHKNKFYFEYTRTRDSPSIVNEDAKKDENENDGKKIVDYNEAGEAIYDDGTVGKINREEDKVPVVDDKSGESDEGMWEETWGGHTDSKPNGPQSVGTDIEIFGAELLYGIPEHAANYPLKPTFVGSGGFDQPYRLYNLDVFEFEINEPMALYGNIPFLMGPGLQGSSAFFWHNPTETYIDIGEKTATGECESYWMSEAGVIDLYLFPGTDLQSIYSQYASLTGKPDLPPLFGLAYHQSRWNYNSQQDVLEVDQKFEENNFPYDVLWLDIEHTDGKKYFTYNKGAFPNPREMLDKLWARGHRMVNIVDPHIKKDDNYEVDKLAGDANLFVKTSSGSVFEGHCWPGTSHYMDHRNPEAFDFWADRFSYDKYEVTPSLHLWNDMNEPSVFNGPEVTMPKDCVGYDKVEHRYWHNVNGFYYTSSCRKGMIERNPGWNLRPFILTRSFYAGSQRASAVWSGDIPCTFEHLENLVHELLSMSTAGLSFYGGDVPGFFHSPTNELFIRFYQAGSWMPFFRAHAHLDSPRREPYLMGEQALNLSREAVVKRYNYLPHWYTLFAENNRTGFPIIRALWMNYPSDLNTYPIEDEYLIGDDLLVYPVVKDNVRSVEVYFPGNDIWYDIVSFEPFTKTKATIDTPINKIPVYQRGGSIIPLQMRVRRSSVQMINDPYTLVICADSSNHAYGTFYMDDTVSFDYLNKNLFVYRSFVFENGILTSQVIDPKGVYQMQNRIERITIKCYNAVSDITIIDSEGERKLESTYDKDRNLLTIRKPNCLISKDFKIIMK